MANIIYCEDTISWIPTIIYWIVERKKENPQTRDPMLFSCFCAFGFYSLSLSLSSLVEFFLMRSPFVNLTNAPSIECPMPGVFEIPCPSLTGLRGILYPLTMKKEY